MSSILDFIKARLPERTSWDGGLIIAGCLAVILFGGLAKIAAWVGLAYGIWTLVKPEE
tara:strand:+ start:1040 stop:1213 length:174 start_codon:yes stop_codon:yes gene_type:complete